MADKLSIYNGALRICKERRLASLTENREPRRLLDDVWGDGQNAGSAVKFCLEKGQWTFATRTVRADYSPSVEPDFGYRYAFDQPDDMVRPVGIYSDPGMVEPILRYADERRYWYTDLQTIYVSYISNHTDYGADLSLWSEAFSKLVEAHLAKEIVGNLTQDDAKIQMAEKNWEKLKTEAASLDAMNKPTKFAPIGSWTRSRHGSMSRNSLWNGRA